MTAIFTDQQLKALKKRLIQAIARKYSIAGSTEILRELVSEVGDVKVPSTVKVGSIAHLLILVNLLIDQRRNPPSPNIENYIPQAAAYLFSAVEVVDAPKDVEAAYVEALTAAKLEPVAAYLFQPTKTEEPNEDLMSVTARLFYQGTKTAEAAEAPLATFSDVAVVEALTEDKVDLVFPTAIEPVATEPEEAVTEEPLEAVVEPEVAKQTKVAPKASKKNKKNKK
jgi:hypothetical protein